jgi:uncharacterized membrane protein
MTLIDFFKKKLDIGIDILEIISYTISFILIFISVIRSIYTYIVEYIDPNIGHLNAFRHTRMDLSQSVALSLSFLLGVQILKLFNIQTYRQLIIVACLVGVKLLISYTLIGHIESSNERKI